MPKSPDSSRPNYAGIQDTSLAEPEGRERDDVNDNLIERRTSLIAAIRQHGWASEPVNASTIAVILGWHPNLVKQTVRRYLIGYFKCLHPSDIRIPKGKTLSKGWFMLHPHLAQG